MQSQVSKFDYFLAFMSQLLNETFLEMDHLTELEKKSIKLTIFHFFQESLDLEETYYRILDYLENEKPELNYLIEKIEIFYNTKID